MKVVVVGCGVAGAEFLKNYSKDTLVVSPDHHLVCQALLPAYVAGDVEEDELCVNLIPFFESRGIGYRQCRAFSIRIECRTLFTKSSSSKFLKEVGYEFAVIAMGGESCTYGIAGIENTLSINNLEQARRARKKVESAKDVVVVGSGMTGVEVAYELSKYCKVTLIEAKSRILPSMCEKASSFVEKILKKAGVKILTSCRVEKIERGVISTSCGELNFDEALWCAGIKGRRLLGLNYGRSGIKVDESLRANQNVFAIGDCADVKINGKIATKTALEAERQAKFVAKSIASGSFGTYKPFSTLDKPFAIMTFGSRGVVVRGDLVLTYPQSLIYRIKRKIMENFLKRFEA